MTYVALLRGVNVGGANKVDMRELKAAFESAGMSDVRTYINSGNVIFGSDLEDRSNLTARLEAGIRERSGFDVGVHLRSVDQMHELVAAIPATWTNDAAMKCDVLFLGEDVDRPQILKDLPISPEIEDTFYVPGAVVRRVDRANATKSRLPRIVGTPLYKRITIRNCNTVRKLLALMEG